MAMAKINIAGKGWYGFRDYPLCYKDPRDVEFLIQDSTKYKSQDMEAIIGIRMSSGSKCQLPFDGTNTEGYTRAMIPIGNEYPTGESISYGFDKYIWSGEDCVHDYYEENVDLSGTTFTVADSSRPRDGAVCAVNLYIEAQNCGRRCTDDGTTIYVIAGGQVERKGFIGRIGEAFDGYIGAAMVGYAVYNYEAWTRAQNYVYVGAAHYALEILADGTGYGILKLLSGLTSLGLFAVDFPLWCMYAYQEYTYYMTNGAFPDTSTAGYEDLTTMFLLTSAPVVEQFMDPANYGTFQTLILSVAAGFYLFTEWTSGSSSLITDSTIMYILSAAAFLYLWALNRIY